jgi:F1F0 ATPase subunit 2
MPSLFVASAAGAGLGLLYFLSVWHTAQGLARARRPALFALSTLAARFALVLPGFYALSGYGWRSLLAALAGFIGARLLLVRRLGVPQGEIRMRRESPP